MRPDSLTKDPPWLRGLGTGLALYAFVGGVLSFSGWFLNLPRLADWLSTSVSIQPNAALLIALSGAGLLLLRSSRRSTLAIGVLVMVFGGLILLQHIVGADFGFNHQLLFGRAWGRNATVTPGQVGPPASFSLFLIGAALILLSKPELRASRRIVPMIGVFVCVLMLFSLMGYLFDARDFYAIPWLSAIALQAATMTLALAAALIVRVPEAHPMLLLRDQSTAGSLARTVLPTLLVMIPSFLWLRVEGEELNFYDVGTSRALGAIALILGTTALLWTALIALRRRELQERDAAEALRESDRRKDAFLATLAHELRNPIAPIATGLKVMEALPPSSEKFAEVRQMIERQVDQLIALVNDLLDVSRITLGKIELRKRTVRLTDIVQTAVESSQPLIEGAQHEFECKLPAEPIELEGNATRLAQVLSNLLNNAAKYTPEPGRIGLVAERLGNRVVISVTDTGIGIPVEMQKSIFKMFTQSMHPLDKEVQGLGIGLALAKSLVEMHQGSIEVHSEGAGKGSEFRVSLPIASVAPATDAPAQLEPNGPAGRKGRILVVDDNQAAAQMLGVLVEMLGHEVRMAYSGRDGVQAAEEFQPDIVFMDLGMPEVNGFDAARQIRQEPWGQAIRLVALTGWGQEEDRQRTKEFGFDRHLVKPATTEDLQQALQLLER